MKEQEENQYKINKYNSRKTIKMTALDLDGTTLRPDKSLSDVTRSALQQASRKGVHVVVTTGRVFSAAPDELKNMEGLEYMINSNGAVITRLRDRKILYTSFLTPDAVDELSEFLKEKKLDVEVFTGGMAYMNEDSYHDLQEGKADYRSEVSRQYVLRTRKPVPDILALLRENHEKIENISLNFRDMDQRKAMFEFLGKRNDVTLTSSVWYNMEIGGKGTSKASALNVLMEKLGVTKEELMACGDSMNDARMIQLAGIGVAMENASEEVKKMADYVTASNAEDGVAKAFEKFVLQ
ncbi:MAG: Cof-type HAD-IIB family hydrolase [Eubacterium sp.]|jgi:Cof subfamily protein (haloacid dehalogenase superfamily)|nr:Cof-type HAD-IIB family hydrolase [Eubacterium sp.]MCH4046145.1 Cof-type HAD-IIB family hydrolase [Eubacterium sp.]MCH4079240.1 Cof-type HAD-IIB family hydrolase [Eubacterium sp.]MCH4110464.1 Cof-type HAD-IIB family hydrolase [Eubacterium sp.]MCI1307975.1 Cof-type HAD-IIB family hydrolase [Eubacterium sp.]